MVSFLQFALVRQEVSRFLSYQINPNVTQAVARLQEEVAQDQYLVKAISSSCSYARRTNFPVPPFEEMATRERSGISLIYLFSVGENKA